MCARRDSSGRTLCGKKDGGLPAAHRMTSRQAEATLRPPPGNLIHRPGLKAREQDPSRHRRARNREQGVLRDPRRVRQHHAARHLIRVERMQAHMAHRHEGVEATRTDRFPRL